MSLEFFFEHSIALDCFMTELFQQPWSLEEQAHYSKDLKLMLVDLFSSYISTMPDHLPSALRSYHSITVLCYITAMTSSVCEYCCYVICYVRWIGKCWARLGQSVVAVSSASFKKFVSGNLQIKISYIIKEDGVIYTYLPYKKLIRRYSQVTNI